MKAVRHVVGRQIDEESRQRLGALRRLRIGHVYRPLSGQSGPTFTREVMTGLFRGGGGNGATPGHSYNRLDQLMR